VKYLFAVGIALIIARGIVGLIAPTALDAPPPPEPVKGHVTVVAGGPRGTIYGRVADAKTGESLVNVSVFVERTELGDATDAHGEYMIAHVPAGKHRLTAAYLGYRDLGANVELDSISGVRADFWLGVTVIQLGHPVE
jgi:hypothetical protein